MDFPLANANIVCVQLANLYAMSEWMWFDRGSRMAKYVRGMHHAKNAFHQRERLMPNEWLFHFIFCCLFLRFLFLFYYFILFHFFLSTFQFGLCECGAGQKLCWPRLTAQILFNCIALYAQRVLCTTWPVCVFDRMARWLLPFSSFEFKSVFEDSGTKIS